MVFPSLQGKNNNKTVMARMYEKVYLLQHENGGRFFCTGNFRALLLCPPKKGGVWGGLFCPRQRKAESGGS